MCGSLNEHTSASPFAPHAAACGQLARSAVSNTSTCPLLPQVVANWRGKLERVAAGEQKWGLFRAFKPKEGRDFHAPEVESSKALA